MKPFLTLLGREFSYFFKTPFGYIIAIAFYLTSMGATLFIGKIFESNHASMVIYFKIVPWVLMIFCSVLGVNAWSEEIRSKNIDLLLALPINISTLVLAKFIANWLFICFCLGLSFPLMITISYLGDPNWGTILAGYLASTVIAATMIALASFCGSTTKSHALSFIFSTSVIMLFLVLGWRVFDDILLGFVSSYFVNLMGKLGLLTHFSSMVRGVVDSQGLAYLLFISMVSFYGNVLAIRKFRV